MEIIYPTAGILLICLVFWANHWNARRRAGMTASERERDDEEDRRESNIW